MKKSIMKNMNQIVHAKYDDIESLASLFAEGFMKDPLYCHYIPYERERPAILLQIFRKYQMCIRDRCKL